MNPSKVCSRCRNAFNLDEVPLKIGDKLGGICKKCQKELGIGIACEYDINVGRGHSPKNIGRGTVPTAYWKRKGFKKCSLNIF